ncbi:hypothetical protein [Streptomyces sp. NRRL F-5123]|uniref:hypothetical protein n=1 Tax=Streptomyces sp. NRRL F-5123 TaxID=1463856 RepID=UPI0004E25EDD|nr:hypothetical protein [Streptomyces sp. NRRL F-5123]
MRYYDHPGDEEKLAPAAILEFSDDLRVADMAPLHDFLVARFGEVAARQPEGTEARWAADCLVEVVAAAGRDLCDLASTWELEILEGDIHEPGLVQHVRNCLQRDWDRLVELALRFADHPDYLPRWRLLRYCCVEHAEFVETAMGDAADAGILHAPGATANGEDAGPTA